MIKDVNDLLKMQAETFQECTDIIKKKNHDYSGMDSSPFSNFEACEVLGIDPVLGILMRCMDKFKRIETFVGKGELRVDGESVDDAFNDVINYMILGKGITLNRRITPSTGHDRTLSPVALRVQMAEETQRELLKHKEPVERTPSNRGKIWNPLTKTWEVA